MEQSPISISYPTSDVSCATLSMRVFKIGDALMLSPNGEMFSFDISYDEAKEMLDYLLSMSIDRTASGLHPFPLRMGMHVANRGVYELDCEIASELTAALVEFVAEHEIGSLLDEYRPN